LFVVARVIIIILGRSGGSDRSLLVKFSFMKTCRSSVPDFFSQRLSPFGVSILALGNTAILRILSPGFHLISTKENALRPARHSAAIVRERYKQR